MQSDAEKLREWLDGLEEHWQYGSASEKLISICHKLLDCVDYVSADIPVAELRFNDHMLLLQRVNSARNAIKAALSEAEGER